MGIRKVTIELTKEINKFYNEGMSYNKLAEKYHLSNACIANYIWNPRPNSGGGKKKIKVTEEIKNEINRLYINGGTMISISKKLGLSCSTVRNYVLEPRQQGPIAS